MQAALAEANTDLPERRGPMPTANAASLDAFRRAFVFSECGSPKRPDNLWPLLAALVLAVAFLMGMAAST